MTPSHNGDHLLFGKRPRKTIGEAGLIDDQPKFWIDRDIIRGVTLTDKFIAHVRKSSVQDGFGTHKNSQEVADQLLKFRAHNDSILGWVSPKDPSVATDYQFSKFETIAFETNSLDAPWDDLVLFIYFRSIKNYDFGS